MTKETFIIFGGGDSSVGIPPTEATITIDDNFIDYDEDMIKQWKEFLYDFYDNGKITILTSKEYEKYCENERNFYG
jgi:hypothetical protein